MAKHIFFGSLGAILVVAVVVGVSAADVDAVTSAKSISAICSSTDYPELCERTLNSASSSKGSATVQDAIHAFVQALAQEVDTTSSLSAKLAEAAKDPLNQQAFANCKGLFTDAAANIQAVAATNGISNTTHENVDEAISFLSAVTSYATSCVEDISDPGLKKSMDDALVAFYELSNNVLTIIANLKDVLQSLGFGSQVPNDRTLLANDRDAEGFPGWIPSGERKLLGRGGADPRAGFKPNAVVAQDGSGQFKSIQAALDAMPKKFAGRYIIYVKAGTYHEYITVKKTYDNVLMYGDGSRKTIVTGSKSYAENTPTFTSAPFIVEAQGFICMYMGFSNTAGPKGHQAVALRVSGDRAVFYRCRMDGYQDTLYAHANHQFYRNCVISGTVDFIFGDSPVIIQNSLILIRKPDPHQFNAMTASGRTGRDSNTGIIIHNCRIQPDAQLTPVRQEVKSYLGRPWKPFSRTVIMESTIGDVIQPVGYSMWDDKTDTGKLYYAEYANRGPGAATGGRVKWSGFHVLNKAQAQQFTVAAFLEQPGWLQGSDVQSSGVRYMAGLKN